MASSVQPKFLSSSAKQRKEDDRSKDSDFPKRNRLGSFKSSRGFYDWFRSYFIFSPGALFSLGLVISHNMVEYACVSFLVTFYTTKVVKETHLAEAAMLMSLQEGLTSLSAVFLSHISDAYVGRFSAIVFSTGAYVTGLTLFWSYARCNSDHAMDVPMFLSAIFLVSLGKGGRDPLQSFLGDQLLSENHERNRDEVSINIWLRSAFIIGATIAIFGFLGAEWVQVFRISTIVTAASGLWFFFGLFWYTSLTPKGSHLSSILKVFKVAMRKFRRNYPDSTDKLYWNHISHERHLYYDEANNNQIMLLPRVPTIFKWVDKAAIIEEPSFSTPEQQESMGRLCSVRQVIQVKCLLMFTYIWVTFIPLSSVLVTANTFFPEQGEKMGDLEIREIKVRFSLFFIIKAFVRDIVIFIFWLSGAKKLRVTLVRIGTGMLCAVIACIVAWKVEVERQNSVKMSVLWLCPQYVLFGLVEGLSLSGSDKLFENHQVEFLRKLGRPLRDLASSAGKLLSIVFILIFRKWFKNFKIDRSHLERYYLVLVGMSSVSLAIYLCVANRYYTKHVSLAFENVR